MTVARSAPSVYTVQKYWLLFLVTLCAASTAKPRSYLYILVVLLAELARIVSETAGREVRMCDPAPLWPALPHG